MSWGRVENPKKVFTVGEEIKVLIKEINGDKIALSLKFPEENPWLTAAEKFAVGNVVEGKVARMTEMCIRDRDMRELIGKPSGDGISVLLAHNPKYGDVYFEWGRCV